MYPAHSLFHNSADCIHRYKALSSLIAVGLDKALYGCMLSALCRIPPVYGIYGQPIRCMYFQQGHLSRSFHQRSIRGCVPPLFTCTPTHLHYHSYPPLFTSPLLTSLSPLVTSPLHSSPLYSSPPFFSSCRCVQRLRQLIAIEEEEDSTGHRNRYLHRRFLRCIYTYVDMYVRIYMYTYVCVRVCA
jgi:hypothetical protein